MKISALLLVAVLLPANLHAQQSPSADNKDVLLLRSGERRLGQFVGATDEFYRLQIRLRADQPPATISIPRKQVDEIRFYLSPESQELLEKASPETKEDLAREWEATRHHLGLVRSPAARFGNLYGEVLLMADKITQARQALKIFQQIEKEAWDEDDRNVAKQGRLRALVAVGRAEEAVEEALQLAEEAEDPSVLIQAKYILAELKDRELRELVEENPRWEEDIRVRPVRAELYSDALDLYLYPYLFFGSDAVSAPRGLWGATRIYAFGGDLANARESARDLTVLYPETKYAALATEFLETLPEEITQQDNEKDAQDTLE